jgi:hypothetical protein
LGRRSPLPGLAILSLLALAILTGCGPAATATDPPASETAAPSSVPPGQTGSPTVSVAPTPTDPPDSLPPVPETTVPTQTVGPSVTPGAARGCTGDSEQQDFFAAVADAVSWDVYCPALPAGWFVQTGSYRLADGGRLQIAYSGPAGSRLELFEGSFCGEADGCVPDGSDAGTAAFGDRQGTLVRGSDGTLSIVVDRGAPISWLIVGTGIDEGTFVEHAATLGIVPA